MPIKFLVLGGRGGWKGGGGGSANFIFMGAGIFLSNSFATHGKAFVNCSWACFAAHILRVFIKKKK